MNCRTKHRTRKTISSGTRYNLLKRAGFKCCYCGASPATNSAVELVIDHAIPFSKGGLDSIENFVVACKTCNAGKSAKSPDEIPSESVIAERIQESSVYQALDVLLSRFDQYLKDAARPWLESQEWIRELVNAYREPWISKKDVPKYAGISKATVDQLIRSGQIRSYWVARGNQVVSRLQLDEYILGLDPDRHKQRWINENGNTLMEILE